jgi:ABC-type polysaccharide/polyol phosphate export permease
MKITRQRRQVLPSESTSSYRNALGFGLRELLKPNYAYRLGIIWIILDPFITASLYSFLIVVVRGDLRGFSVLLGILTLQSMNKSISRNLNMSLAREPFPLMHTPSRHLIISRYSTDLFQSFAIGTSGAIILFLVGSAPIAIGFHLPIICAALSLFGTSIGLIFSSIAIKIKDIQRLVSFALLGSLFLFPVLYDFEMTSGQHSTFLSLMPHTLGVEWLRHITFGDTYPFTRLHVMSVLFVWFLAILIGMNQVDKNRWRLSTWS